MTFISGKHMVDGSDTLCIITTLLLVQNSIVYLI